jgi:hypothetical protein
MAAGLGPGESAGLLLIEHVWRPRSAKASRPEVGRRTSAQYTFELDTTAFGWISVVIALDVWVIWSLTRPGAVDT